MLHAIFKKLKPTLIIILTKEWVNSITEMVSHYNPLYPIHHSHLNAHAMSVDDPSERISNVHISNHLQSGPAVSYSPHGVHPMSVTESRYICTLCAHRNSDLHLVAASLQIQPKINVLQCGHEALSNIRLLHLVAASLRIQTLNRFTQ
jgi:hypothetical protein